MMLIVILNNIYANDNIETSFIVNLNNDSFGLIPFTVVVNSDYIENDNDNSTQFTSAKKEITPQKFINDSPKEKKI